MEREYADEFIESWGEMGMLWGVNRSIARIHALLILSDQPQSLDDIATRLKMSRGNTSMSLRELRTWGVVERVKVPGDRRDFYESDQDIWRMFFKIFNERKRRELDPALAAVRRTLRSTDASDSDAVRQRLAQMEELLGTMERVMTRFLANEKTSRSMLRFLTGWIADDTA